MRTRLQLLYGNYFAWHEAPLLAIDADPAWRGTRDQHRTIGPRTGLRSGQTAGVASPSARAGGRCAGSNDAAGSCGRMRRDVSERGGKKAKNTPIRPIRRVVAPTRCV